MSNDDKGKSVISFSEKKKEKLKPRVFKTGVEEQWTQHPNKLEAFNSHIQHIKTMLRTSADHIEAVISVRRDIKDIEYDMAEYSSSKSDDDEYHQGLMQYQADLNEHEDSLGKVLKEDCLKSLIIDLHEYEMIDLEDIIDTINTMAEEEES